MTKEELKEKAMICGIEYSSIFDYSQMPLKDATALKDILSAAFADGYINGYKAMEG